MQPSAVRPLHPQLTRRSAGAWVLALVGLLLIAWADEATGTAIRIYPLYFLPLALIATRTDLYFTLASTVVATALWALANHLGGSQDSWFLLTVNAASQLIAFSVVAALVNRLTARAEGERRLARTDPLTGLCNARALYENAERELERQRRYRRPLSIAYLDLDGFKRVNDELGHLEADALLIRVAAALRQGIRATDVVARLGGDEFVILYPEADEAQLSEAVRRLQQVMLQRLSREPVRVTFSLGGITFVEPQDSVQRMLFLADSLMYEVKNTGKNAARIAQVTSRQAPGPPVCQAVALPPSEPESPLAPQRPMPESPRAMG